MYQFFIFMQTPFLRCIPFCALTCAVALPAISAFAQDAPPETDELISVQPATETPVGTPVIRSGDVETAVETARDTLEATGTDLPSDADIRSAVDQATGLIPEEVPDSLRDAAIEASRNFQELDAATARAQQAFEQFSSATMEQRQLVSLRKARNEIVQTPELEEARRLVDNARTDEERRQARIAYYELLYSRLEKAVPAARETLEQQKMLDLDRLQFKRVRSHEEVAAEEAASLGRQIGPQ